MANNDLCSWIDQWRNGWVSNPRQEGKLYLVDLKVKVISKDHGPKEWDLASKRSGFWILTRFDVPISKEAYLELMEKKSK
jgi:hypothetical protein